MKEPLSGGQEQILAIRRALTARARLLLPDEPSMGLVPNLVDQVLAVVRALKDKGLAILLVDQNSRAALAIANRSYKDGWVTLAEPRRRFRRATV